MNFWIYMKKIFFTCLIIFSLNLFFNHPAHAAGGIVSFFKAIANLLKGSGDNIVNSADDLIRNGKNQIENFGKGGDDILKDIKNKQLGNAANTSDESLILEKIGSETHAAEFKNLKESSRSDYITKIRRSEIDQLMDDDLLEFFESINSGSDEDKFKEFVILNWIGKIYRVSNYFNKPVFEEKSLLVCKNVDQVFYIALLMEKEPRRAILTKHEKFKESIKKIPSQELFIIEDTDNRKIMTTWPRDTEFPEHYFVIYNNQNFYYENPTSGKIGPDKIKLNLNNRKVFKNKCFKATETGLL